MRRLQSNDTAMSTSRNRAVYWVNLPFFELKKYSSEKHSSELFPAQTLMQADYSQHLMARDMQQAVRQIKEGTEGHCFHISQLWGIIIDNCEHTPQTWCFLLSVSHSRLLQLSW